ncbi:hypothetical protein IVB41_17125 [Bradyrhizobium sp. 44]|jgi:hypothetical protein|uniref:hypothetical protein n=2 Tax=unclassified Bradyrhizobium TaxID=2631580 RepID=UPI0004884DA1|nr:MULTISPECIES: hypothetical protein [unclassified Bradyrhizobium]MCK1285645.1 hypothetical protein [Bradyrhizobium sp. 44]UPJ40316.1 hypothetical protein IVB40_23780 [Bradyrhizobium sp. 40]
MTRLQGLLAIETAGQIFTSSGQTWHVVATAADEFCDDAIMPVFCPTRQRHRATRSHSMACRASH